MPAAPNDNRHPEVAAKRPSKDTAEALGSLPLRGSALRAEHLRACEDFGCLAEFDGRRRTVVIRSDKDSLILDG